ncbi:MAG: 30S ribosomal protein S2 [Candidatus Omnitrophica bacterium]|nr:30S ribosomal protein S2 [Candidatus Omnitrophota bacterium]
MENIDVKKLLEAGVHFGHQTRRWNPKMAPYIYGERNGIYIIDLERALECLKRACEFVESITAEGRNLLFVGTKKQAQEAIDEAAKQSEMPHVSVRWLGGMLTNFETVRKSVEKLDNLEKMEQEGTYAFYTKKEVLSMRKEREKLDKVLSGVRKMKKLPGGVFIVDPKKEINALKECAKLNIPSIALIDTNSDPDLVTYPIPGNDDALRSIKLICDAIADAACRGRARFDKTEAKRLKDEEDKKEADTAHRLAEEAEEIEEKEAEALGKAKLEDKAKPRVKPKKVIRAK